MMNPRNWSLSLVSLLLIGSAPAALAGAASESRTDAVAFETLQGKVRSVGEESFVLMVGSEAKTVPLSATTKYFLDDKEARKEQVLKVDKEVSVTLENGSATKVSGRSTL